MLGKGDAAFSRVGGDGTRPGGRIPEEAPRNAVFRSVDGGGETRPGGRIPTGGHVSKDFPFEITTPTEGYLNAFRPLDAARHNLPHWDQADTFVFITFRLADSLPKERLEQWRQERDAWLRKHPEPLDEPSRAEYVRLFPARLENWLDAGTGDCLLRNPDARKIVEDSLVHFHGTRCDMRCFTVMPNHVHALFRGSPGHSLSDIVHSWKGYSGSAINRLLGRKGAVWQKEYFDTCIRNPAHFRRVVRYIWNNAPALDRFRWADGLLWDKAGERISGGYEDVACGCVESEETRPGGRIAGGVGDAAFSRVESDGETRPEGRIPEDDRLWAGRGREIEP